MNARKLAAALVLALAVSGPGARGAESENATLSTLVVGLQRLQDRVAAGDLAAFKAQPAALKSIATAIDAASPGVWNDKDERIAAVIYLLSGGAPGPVARQMRDDFLSKEEGALIRAALANATGRRREAKALFDRLDVRKMDVRLAGQLAYAHAELLSEEDQAQALAALDLARLLSPGGLVEEAALRREIRILAATHDADRFCSLSRQYLQRFPHSLYFDNFRQSFSAALERAALDEGFAEIGKYLDLAKALPPDDRRRALLTLARAAVLNARSQAAITFAQPALQETPADSADHARARLYNDAARILLGDDAQAASDLETLPAERLGQKDSALLDAVRKVSRAVAREVSIPQGAKEPVEDSAMIRSAQDAIQRAASLVSENVGEAR